MARIRTRTNTARRKRVWARNDEVLTSIGAAGSVFDLAGDLSVVLGTNTMPMGATVRGILADLAFEVTTPSTSTAAGITIGIIRADIVVSGDVPTPETEPHADWMWYQFIHFGTAAAGTRRSTFESLGGPLRIGAQRKIEEAQTRLWCVVQTTGAALVVDGRVRTSTLLLLP